MAPQRYVVLVRGINVGSNRKLPMATLRSLCETAGCTDVTTYIQSGNVVLDSDRSEADLEPQLESLIEDEVGFRPSVMVRRSSELEAALDRYPFDDAAPEHRHVGFLSEPTGPAALLPDTTAFLPERYAVDGTHLYLHLPLGVGRSPLLKKHDFERLLGVPVTLRNWRTVTRLRELAAG